MKNDEGKRSCPTLAKALKRLEGWAKPHILDLGPLCGATAVFLADRGARVTVEPFVPPAPLPTVSADGEPVEVEPYRIDRPDASCDLVLAWEAFDFTPPDRLEEVAAELRRLLAPGGQLLLFSRNTTGGRKTTLEVPGRFLVEAVDSVAKQPNDEPACTRWVHPTREIERALHPLAVQGIHLQRDQTREILALSKTTT